MKKLIAVLAVAAVFVVACAKDDLPIDRLVTDKVIDMAVASLASDIVGQHGYSYTRAEGITWTVCMKARHAVYATKMGADWFDELYASIAAASNNFSPDDYWMQHGGSRTKFDQYQTILSIARHALDTPEELRAAYVRHRATALQCVRQAGIENKVAEQIGRVLPYFDGTAPDSTVSLLRAYRADIAAGYAGGDSYDVLKKHSLTIEDVRAYEFAERRRAEGGDALVAAWGWILTDFVFSLQDWETATIVPEIIKKQ